MTPKQDGFKDFVLDQLRDLRGVTGRSMFGGYGLSCRGAFFGIIHKGRLYFKVTAASAALYTQQGMKPFQPTRKHTLRTYYEVPPEVLEDSERLALWAERAMVMRRSNERLGADQRKRPPSDSTSD